jgi:hypothetical protein
MSFDKDLVNFSKRTGVELDKTVRKIALELYDGITAKTPVDTGRAKGNWNMSVGKKNTKVNVMAKGKQGVSLKKGDGEKPIYITNSLPYINTLENGSSKQASAGMVDITVNEVRASLL